MAIKKKKTEGHENHERWLLTYADMITLLVAFFMMLYSMSIVNLQKFHALAVSVRSGFGGIHEGGGRSVLGGGASMTTKPVIAPEGSSGGALGNTEKLVIKYIEKNGLGEVIRVHTEERGLVITLATDKVLFDIGSADLKPRTREILLQIGKILKGLPNTVRVEGHTCDLPVHNAQFQDNWELSTRRATNVIRFLINTGILPKKRLEAAGYADSRPLKPNTNEANRARNRRVDIVILRNL